MIDDQLSIYNKNPLADKTNHTSRFSSRVDLPIQSNRSNNSFFSDKSMFKTAYSKHGIKN